MSVCLSVQVDNKLATSHCPILAYPSPYPSSETGASYPVLVLHVEKIPCKSPFALVFKVSMVAKNNWELFLLLVVKFMILV